MRQLLDGQEYPVSKVDIIKKVFDHEASVELFVAYLHGLYQLTSCPSYTGDRIKSFTWLQLIPIDNNNMLGAAQLMVDFWWMHFNAKKDVYINIQKQDSIFC